MSFLSLVHLANKFRLDVGVVYFLLAWLYLRDFTPLSQSDALLMAIVLTCYLMTAYLFNRLTDRVEDRLSQPKEALAVAKTGVIVWILISLVILPLLILVWLHGPIGAYLALLPMAFLYSLPLSKRGFRLKQIFLVKNLYAVVFGWVGSIAVFVLILPHDPSLEPQLLRSLGYAGCLIIAYEIIWDIRDISGDRAAVVKTVPVVFGELKAKALAFFFLLLGGSLYWPNLPSYLVTNIAYVALAVGFSSQTAPGWYFHLILYGQAVFLISALVR